MACHKKEFGSLKRASSLRQNVFDKENIGSDGRRLADDAINRREGTGLSIFFIEDDQPLVKVSGDPFCEWVAGAGDSRNVREINIIFDDEVGQMGDDLLEECSGDQATIF